MALRRLLLATADEELALLLQLEIGDLLPDLAVNTAAAIPEALALAKVRRPDVVMFGLDTPGDSTAISLLAEAAHGASVIVMSRQRGPRPQVPGIVARIGIPVTLAELRSALDLAAGPRIREAVEPAMAENAVR